MNAEVPVYYTEKECHIMAENKFSLLSYSVGMGATIHVLTFLYQIYLYRSKKTWIARLPVLVTLCFCIQYAHYGVANFELSSFWFKYESVVSGVFECFGKILSLYYLTFRVLVLIRIHPAIYYQVLFVILFGVITTIASASAAISVSFVHLGHDFLDEMMYIYYYSDIYISFSEIWSLYMYIKYKYSLRTYREVWATMKRYKLVGGSVMIIVFLALSIMYTFWTILVEWYDPGNIQYSVLELIKYTYSCNLATEAYSLTMENTVIGSSDQSGNTGMQSRSRAVSDVSARKLDEKSD
jgi:hypothetical protein